MLGLDCTFPAVDGAVPVVDASLESSELVPGVVSGVLGMIPVSCLFTTDVPNCQIFF